MEEEDVRGDRGLSVFRLRAVSRLTLVVRCTEISYSVSTQVLGFRFGCGWCCVVGFLFGCCWFCVLLLCVSAWWNRGILDEVTKASDGRAVTGTAVMARSANEEKKRKIPWPWLWPLAEYRLLSALTSHGQQDCTPPHEVCYHASAETCFDHPWEICSENPQEI